MGFHIFSKHAPTIGRVGLAGWLVGFLGGLGTARPGSAAELRIDLRQFNRLTLQAGPPEDRLLYDPVGGGYQVGRLLAEVPEDAWYATVVRAGVRLSAWDVASVTLQLDTGELRPSGRRRRLATFRAQEGPRLGTLRVAETARIDRAATASGRTVPAFFEDVGYLRELHGSLDLPIGLGLDLGLIETRMGDGFVFDGTTLGGRVLLDLDPTVDLPVNVVGQVGAPYRLGEPVGDGLVAELRVEWRLSLLESVALFGVGWWDAERGFEAVHGPWLAEVAAVRDASSVADAGWISGLDAIPPQARTAMRWLGARGEVFVGDVLLSGRAMINTGRFEAANPRAVFRNIGGAVGGVPTPNDARVLRYDALGFAADLSARWLADGDWLLEAFGLYLSGAENPFLPGSAATVGDPYGGFIGIAPLLTHTNLFFNGGINRTFTGQLGHTAGVLGHGALVGGVAAHWDRAPWSVRASAAGIGADVPSALTGARFHGVEIDTECVIELAPWIALSAEYDVLFGGSFWRTERAIQRGVLGVDLRWGDDV